MNDKRDALVLNLWEGESVPQTGCDGQQSSTNGLLLRTLSQPILGRWGWHSGVKWCP